jgi:hypothetical protein
LIVCPFCWKSVQGFCLCLHPFRYNAEFIRHLLCNQSVRIEVQSLSYLSLPRAVGYNTYLSWRIYKLDSRISLRLPYVAHYSARLSLILSYGVPFAASSSRKKASCVASVIWEGLLIVHYAVSVIFQH